MRRNAFVLASAIVLVAACSTTTGSGSAPAGGGSGGTIKIGGGFALTGDESADLPAANGAGSRSSRSTQPAASAPRSFHVHDSQYKMDVAAQTAKQFVGRTRFR
jgi:hypothetical protein